MPPPPPTVLTPSPAAHNFGNVYVGTSATSPAVSWTNVSAANVEVIGVIPVLSSPITLNTAAPFVAFMVAPGAATPAFTFVFAPTQAGPASATGTPQLPPAVTGIAAGQALTGQGVFQDAVGALVIGGGNLVVGQFLDFGQVGFPGGPPTTRTFNLTNTNTNGQPMRIQAQFIKGGQGFSITAPAAANFPVTIPVGGQVQITIRFAPGAVGVFTDAVTFADLVNGANVAGTSLRGEGVLP